MAKARPPPLKTSHRALRANQRAQCEQGTPWKPQIKTREISIISGEAESACGGLSSDFQKQVEEEETQNLPACQVRESMQAASRPPLERLYYYDT